MSAIDYFENLMYTMKWEFVLIKGDDSIGIPKKIRVTAEMPNDNYIVDVPEYIKTEQQLLEFAEYIASEHYCFGYDEVDETWILLTYERSIIWVGKI